MRVSEEFLRKVDNWRRGQADLPSRAEAIRRLIDQALGLSPAPSTAPPAPAAKPSAITPALKATLPKLRYQDPED
jgi:hypothetical protein